MTLLSLGHFLSIGGIFAKVKKSHFEYITERVNETEMSFP